MDNFFKQINRKTLIIFFLIALFFIFSPTSFAEEKINNFDVQIKINSDASILVTEIIKYDFGDIEKHGIFRDIPINYETSIGNKSINIDLQSVAIDGYPEEYEISKNGPNLNIRIGKEDTLIKGEHTYSILYKIEGAINYFKDIDELYWNVTGNGWVVSIENVQASVELPVNNIIKADLSCYEGVLGSNEKCITKIEDNIFMVTSARPLQAGEGLTLALDFAKGLVYEPTKLENFISLIKDNYVLFFPFIVFIVMFFIWRKYGKDPKGLSTIIAEYEPPLNMKPTLVGSLVDERPDNRDITAGLVYLAEQGFLRIKRLEKDSFLGGVDYELELVKNEIDILEKTEQNILKLFFGDISEINTTKKISSLKRDTSFTVKAKKIIKDLYQEMKDRGFFVNNLYNVQYKYVGIPLILILFGSQIISDVLANFGIMTIISFFLSVIIIIVFGIFMGKKTKIGAETKDHILGFKLFLSVTEKDRLDFHNAPEKNPDQFMKFLPYAIALGVENKWAKQFKDIYIEQPTWYSSNVVGSFIIVDFASHMSNFSSSVNAGLSVVSKNAAHGGFGGGGGGFSGGGFGGGGGGSW